MVAMEIKAHMSLVSVVAKVSLWHMLTKALKNSHSYPQKQSISSAANILMAANVTIATIVSLLLPW